ncbi:MAG: hypothetical protein K9N10_11490 [Deltaproteobacteria bacterium]|nr:hypothetical protein [Deltaproteobacteria bacterium]
MLNISKTSKRLLLLLLPFFLWSCTHGAAVSPQRTRAVYTVSPRENSLVNRFAPDLLANGYQNNQNRIGAPEVKYTQKGEEEIHMDVRKPAMYWTQQKFTTSKRTYTNLIYRIHFPEVPLSLFPFYLTAGKNVGLLLIITLDVENRPVLVTTSGTCGCYAVTIPTQYLDKSAYPKDWNGEKPLHNYGETLPPLLNFSSFDQPKLLVHLRSDVHRVMDLEVVDAAKPGRSGVQETIETSLLPMGDLEKIPAGMGRTTSLYYNTWPYRGLVKGSFKCWETLSMSLMSLDFFVGTDKIYGDSSKTGTRFYTSLKPWNREASDMWHFERFLMFNGWNL